MKKWIYEFREFAARGNVVDMAVGILVGSAFGKITAGFVDDIIMPPLGKILGGVDFSNLFLSLDPAKTAGIKSLVEAQKTGAAIITYGSFVNIVINFLIVAFCMFLMVKGMNRLRRRELSTPTPARTCPYCCLDIPTPATRCGHCSAELK